MVNWTAGEIRPFANHEGTHVGCIARNYVLFRTDLFVFRQRDKDIDQWFVGGDCAGWFYMRLLLMDHIQPKCHPVMEDWGWVFEVPVDDICVNVCVWAFSIENCWLFGLTPTKFSWFRPYPAEKLAVVREVVANALEKIMATDARIEEHEWFADNPFMARIKDF